VSKYSKKKELTKKKQEEKSQEYKDDEKEVIEVSDSVVSMLKHS
jgi:hypothetical protein